MKSGKPLSIIVGTAGSQGARSAPQVASAMTPPLSICGFSGR